jgi:hypothetical protein
VAGSCEHDNEPSGSKNGREFLDCLSDCQLLKNCAPWSELGVASFVTEFLYSKLSPFYFCDAFLYTTAYL